jgi:hypothetical protein
MPLLVNAADGTRVFRADGSVDRRLEDAAMREIARWRCACDEGLRPAPA